MNSIKKNFAYNAFYQILSFVIPLVTTPYISRTLGPAPIGIYSYYYSIGTYFVLFTLLGLNNYGNREIAKARDDNKRLSKTFWNIYAVQVACGIIVNICYMLFCFFFSNNKAVSFAMWLYVASASFDINWFFFGIEKFKLTVTRNTIIKLLTTASIFILIKEPNDILFYCVIIAGGALLSQLFMWPYLFKEVKFVAPTWKELKRHIKPNLALFLTVIAVSLFKIMDKIMLGMMSPAEQVGFYESSERIVQIPTALVTSLGIVMLPRMSNLIARKEGDISDIIRKSIVFAMFISTSLCFGIMGVSKEFVPLFYGSGYDTCIFLYLILLPSGLFYAFANVIRTQYLLPNEMDRPYIISAFLGAGVNIAINAILIPILGAIGAAVGTLFAEMVVCIYQCISASRGVKITDYLKDSLIFIISGTVMFFVIYCIDFPFSPFQSLFIKIIIGVATYILCAFMCMFLLDREVLGITKDLLKIKR